MLSTKLLPGPSKQFLLALPFRTQLVSIEEKNLMKENVQHV
jgi:hypothetical protein